MTCLRSTCHDHDHHGFIGLYWVQCFRVHIGLMVRRMCVPKLYHLVFHFLSKDWFYVFICI